MLKTIFSTIVSFVCNYDEKRSTNERTNERTNEHGRNLNTNVSRSTINTLVINFEKTLLLRVIVSSGKIAKLKIKRRWLWFRRRRRWCRSSQEKQDSRPDATRRYALKISVTRVAIVLYSKLVCLSRELPRVRERRQHDNKGFFGQPWREERRTADEEKERRGRRRKTKKDGRRSLVELLRSLGPGARKRGRQRVDEQVLRSLEKWISHRFRVIPGPTVHQKRSLTCVKTLREQILLL